MSERMHPYNLLTNGRFSEAAAAYRAELSREPDDIASAEGLAKALMGLGDFAGALPLFERVHASYKSKTADHPGSTLEMAVCLWRSGAFDQARELLASLCSEVLKKTVNMAPDLAGGATFGLVLLYMAVSEDGGKYLPQALDYLAKLNAKYQKRPYAYRFPKQIVQQALGTLTFDDVLKDEFGHSDMEALKRLAESSRPDAGSLKDAMFFDAVICRYRGDESGFHGRVKEAAEVRYFAGDVIWHLIQHELHGNPADTV
jgi:tetratricopeptide (TPR) repeat protein